MVKNALPNATIDVLDVTMSMVCAIMVVRLAGRDIIATYVMAIKFITQFLSVVFLWITLLCKSNSREPQKMINILGFFFISICFIFIKLFKELCY